MHQQPRPATRSGGKRAAAGPGRDDHVLALVHMLSNRIGKAFASELRKFGVTVAEWRVILTLGLRASANGQEITGRWAMDKMAVNRAISGLERRGLVAKRKNRADRRTIDLSLTASGRALYAELLPAANERYRTLTQCLDRSEAKRLHDLLVKMIAHADAITE